MSIAELPHHLHRLPPPRPFTMPTTGVGAVDIITGGGILAGWALEETTGAAVARAVIGDGNVGGVITQPIAPVRLAANESNREYPPHGVVYRRSLSVQVTAGSVAGVLWVIIMTQHELGYLLDLTRY